MKRSQSLKTLDLALSLLVRDPSTKRVREIRPGKWFVSIQNDATVYERVFHDTRVIDRDRIVGQRHCAQRKGK